MKKRIGIFLMLLVLVFMQDSYAQSAKDKYKIGIDNLMLAKKQFQNVKSRKMYCTKAINQFTEAKSMDFKWADNCDEAIVFARKAMAAKGTWPKENLPKFTPIINIIERNISISDEGYTNDTVHVQCVTFWDAVSKEGGFLFDKFTKVNEGIVINTSSNPYNYSRRDTIVITTRGEYPETDRVIVTQKGSPIKISFCIDGDDKWYSTENMDNIPEIDVKKFSDEYRSIRLEVYPESERNNWAEKMKITLPEWCERLTEVKDTRNFIQKTLGVGETRTQTDYGEVYFKTLKQQKKKGSSGITRNGEITIEYKGIILSIPIKQNQ